MAPFAAGALSPMLDGVFISLIIVHTYIGFQYVPHPPPQSLLPWARLTFNSRSVITDYAPRWRVPKSRRLLDWANTLALFVVGWGWYEFETNDVGLTAAVKRVWRA